MFLLLSGLLTKNLNCRAATSAAPCAGTVYAIQPGDTCQSISLDKGIGTEHLLHANSLRAYCHQFPTTGNLCIPDDRLCTPYQLHVIGNDTCVSIAEEHGITWAQVISWNPEVGTYCDNLDQLAPHGHVLCVSHPGGDYVNPSPDPTTEPPPWASVTSTASETYFTLSPIEFASWTSVPPAITSSYPNAHYVDPIANGSVLECDLYRKGPVPGFNGTDSFNCTDFADFYNITIEDLKLWNPSLAINFTFTNPLTNITQPTHCELVAGQQYCAHLDLLEAEGITESCVNLEIADPGLTSDCQGFRFAYGLDNRTFFEWHSNLEEADALDPAECEGWRRGRAYCARVHHFRLPSKFVCRLMIPERGTAWKKRGGLGAHTATEFLLYP